MTLRNAGKRMLAMLLAVQLVLPGLSDQGGAYASEAEWTQEAAVEVGAETAAAEAAQHSAPEADPIPEENVSSENTTPAQEPQQAPAQKAEEAPAAEPTAGDAAAQKQDAAPEKSSQDAGAEAAAQEGKDQNAGVNGNSPAVQEAEAGKKDAQEGKAETPAANGNAPEGEARIAGTEESAREGQESREKKPVQIKVLVTPEDAKVEIFPLDDEEPIPPEKDGSWLLLPGKYTYSAAAEGYDPAEQVAFEVPEQEKEYELKITLTPAEDASAETEAEAVPAVNTTEMDPEDWPGEAVGVPSRENGADGENEKQTSVEGTEQSIASGSREDARMDSSVEGRNEAELDSMTGSGIDGDRSTAEKDDSEEAGVTAPDGTGKDGGKAVSAEAEVTYPVVTGTDETGETEAQAMTGTEEAVAELPEVAVDVVPQAGVEPIVMEEVAEVTEASAVDPMIPEEAAEEAEAELVVYAEAPEAGTEDVGEMPAAEETEAEPAGLVEESEVQEETPEDPAEGADAAVDAVAGVAYGIPAPVRVKVNAVPEDVEVTVTALHVVGPVFQPADASSDGEASDFAAEEEVALEGSVAADAGNGAAPDEQTDVASDDRTEAAAASSSQDGIAEKESAEVPATKIVPVPAPGEMIPAGEEGVWLLWPGDYLWSASAEGYISAENMLFTVPSGEAEMALTVTLEKASVPFSQTQVVDGVAVTVQADAGAFPADALLHVEKVPVAQQAQVDAALQEARDNGQNVAVSYTFDIQVLAPDGTELQPAEGFQVAVSFALAQVADQNLEASVYHLVEDEAGALTAEKLKTEENPEEQTLQAGTDGFSIYTVEFTYQALQYVLRGGSNVPLSEILASVGLVGEPESASVSDAALFSVSKETGSWVLTSHQPFTTRQWLKVLLSGVEYEITVTDDSAEEVLYYADGQSVSVTAVAVTEDTEELNESTSAWYVVNDSVELENRLEITGNVNLILNNGCTLTATNGIHLIRGNQLAVYPQSEDGNGQLVADASMGEFGLAGIGGNKLESGGDFAMYGGIVKATGALNAAGIGGGESGSGGNITVKAGTLTVQGGDSGAGLGGGFSGSQGGKVTIHGGTVSATGGNYGAGIGGGENFNDLLGDGEVGGNGGQVSIQGGHVTAQGGYDAAGIGGGTFGSGGTLRIDGRTTVTAIAGSPKAQAIGQGIRSSGAYQTEGSIVLPDSVEVKAGEDAGSAEQTTAIGREEGCRKPYAQLTGSGKLSYAFDTKINQVRENTVTDTIDIKNEAKKSIAKADPGDTFVVELELQSALVNLLVSYTSGDKTHFLAPTRLETVPANLDPMKPDTWGGTSCVASYYYTMPTGVEDVVLAEAVVKAREYRIFLPEKPEHGQVSAVVYGQPVQAAAEGAQVTLLTPHDSDSPDYFVQMIEVKGKNKGTIYCKLVNDTVTGTKDLARGTDKNGNPDDTRWTFSMPDEDVEISVSFAKGFHYINLNGEEQIRRYFHLLSNMVSLTMNGDGVEGGWYAVPAGEIILIMSRTTVTGDVNLILGDGSSIIFSRGIFVNQQAHGSLTIWAQNDGTGSLYADASGTYGAGIGSNKNGESGTVTINGGRVIAQGGYYSAGISGGQYSETNTVTINCPAGKPSSFTDVKATGGKYGAGIGGGEDRNNYLTVINGGTVTAIGGAHGAGIGGGEGGGNDRIEIHGGIVKATGGELAAGLGGGEAYRGGGFGGVVLITGGDVNATGSRHGAGIGGGEDGEAADVTISGGKVTAAGGESAAGIGGGEGKPGGTVNISGGTVNVKSGSGGAGIGGGVREKGGTVRITGGDTTVEASGESQVPIGSGMYHSSINNGSLHIDNDMMVEATNFKKETGKVEAAKRVSACQYNKSVRIRACDHSGGDGYVPIDKKQHYTPSCIYCSLGRKAENHVWGGVHDATCQKCGYVLTNSVVIYTSLGDVLGESDVTLEVTSDKAPVKGKWMGAHWYGQVMPGAAVKINISIPGGYYFTGEKAEIPEAVKNYAEMGDDASRTSDFVMPDSESDIRYWVGKRNLEAHIHYNADLGSVRAAHSMNDNVIHGTRGGTNVLYLKPASGYTALSVQAYERLADGSDGEAVSSVKFQQINQYGLTFENASLNIYVNFGRSARARIYHVVPRYGEDGQLFWPDVSDLKPLSGGEIGTYRFHFYVSETVLEEGLTDKDYTRVGYSLNAYAPEKSEPIPQSREIAIPEDNSRIFLYFMPKNGTLNVYDSRFEKIEHTFTVPAGTPIARYLRARGLTPGSVDGVERKWAVRDKGTPDYTLLTEKSIMPAGAYNVFPADSREYVHVLLDLNGPDRAVEENQSVRGAYWGDWDHDPNFAYSSVVHGSGVDSQDYVHMDPKIDRAWRLEMGQPFPQELVDAMNGAYRTGYRLAGWSVIQDRGAQQAWDPGKGAVSEYFYDADTRTYRDGEDKGRRYHYIVLRASWTMRDAVLEFDLDGGTWQNGAPAVVRYAPGSEIPLPRGDSAPVKNSGGWILRRWRSKSYPYTSRLDYRNDHFYDVTERAATTDPEAVNIIRLKAEYVILGNKNASLRFVDSLDGSEIDSRTITIPAGQGSMTCGVSVGENATEIHDEAEKLLHSMELPTRQGHEFLGWSQTKDGPAQQAISLTYSRDKYNDVKTQILYAQWAVKEYPLTLDLNGGSWKPGSVYRENYPFGETIDQTQFTPIRQDYDFLGWEPALPETMPDQAVNAAAQWQAHEYVLSFSSEIRNEKPYELRAVKGEDIADRLPADPVWVVSEDPGDDDYGKNYVFDGWDPGDPPAVMPGEDRTYTARWLEVPTRPEAPKAKAESHDTLAVVDPVEGQEYSLDGGETWVKPQDGRLVFEGLAAGVTYEVVTRVAEVPGVSTASQVSDPTQVSMPKAVAVKLDLGALDALKEDPGYVDPYDAKALNTYTDETTKAWLDVAQHRSFLKYEGDAVTIGRLEGATRDGYVLAGWYNQANVRVETTLDVLQINFDEAAHAGTAEDPCVITLTARWTLRPADIVYDTNNEGAGWTGEAPAAQTVACGETAEVTSVLPKAPEGHRFVCWENPKSGARCDAGADLEYTDLSAAEVKTGSEENNVISLKAVYENKPAAPGVLVFDSREGSAVSSLNVTIPEGKESVTVVVSMDEPGEGQPAQTFSVKNKDGEAVRSEMAAPTRTGHTFAGWTDEEKGAAAKASFEVEFTRPEQGTPERTVYAVWNVNTYTITFDTLGGTDIAPVSQAYGTAVSVPENPEKNHYAFDGWNPALPETMPAGDLTVTAVWKPVQYHISFVTGGGTAIAPITAAYGERITPPADPVRGGYVFNGWMLQGGSDVAVTLPETMPDTNPVYAARWLVNPGKPASPKMIAKTRTSLTVEAVAGQEYALAEGRVTSPGENPTWVKDPTYTGLIPGAEYSVFTRVAEVEGAVASEISDPTATRLPHAVKVRLDLGAYDLVAAEGHVEGVWQNPDPYTDTLTPARLTAEQARSFLKDEGVVIEMLHMADISRDGYSLAGWYTQGGVRMESTLGAVSSYYDDASPAGTEEDPFVITLNARWIPRTADIVYDTNNEDAGWTGEAPAAQTAAYGETAEVTSVLPKAPEGQQFVCWENPKSGRRYDAGADLEYTDLSTAEFTADSEENNSITLKAVYENKPAAPGVLVFDSREGSAVSSLNVTIPEGKESVTVIVSMDDHGAASGNASSEGEDAGQTFSVGYRDGALIRSDMPVPTRTGHTFAGWTDEEKGAGGKASVEVEFTRQEQGAPERTVYAVWNVNTYTITFDTLGGTAIEPVTQAYGTAVTAPADPEKAHFTFDGWNPALPAAMPAGDLTVTAVWKAIQYHIFFVTDGGTEIAPITAAYGERIAASADPERGGYVFNGWKLQGGDGGAVSLPETMPDTNPTYVARWLENPAKPASPKVIAKTRTSLTVEAVAGQEYALAEGRVTSPGENPTWVKDPTYTGLTPGGEYSVFTRVAATEGAVASEVSDPTAAQLPHAVKIRLDLGAYDLVAQTESVEGVWKDPDPYTDQTTPARLTAAQHRSFMKDEGAVIEMLHMADITRDGYRLEGWYTQGGVRMESTLGAVSSYYDDATPAGTEEDPFVITLMARWIPRTADIVYDTNNEDTGWTGEAPAAQTAAYGETVEVTSVLPKAPEGQRFVCWENPKSGRRYDAGADLEYTDLSTAEFAADSEKNNVITLKAVYENKPAAPGVLVFDSREGSAVSSLNVTIPEGKESVTVVVSMDAPGAASGDPASEGENAGQTFSVRYQDGEEVRSTIAAPARTGHTFLGWTDEAEGAGAKASFEVLFTRDSSDAVADQTVYAVWQVNTYTITFDTLGGTEIAPITQACGTAVSAPENPTKEHYAFDGWNPALPAAMPAGDLTVLAQWKPVQYTISFDTDGGSPVETITAAFGARITAPADPMRDGSVFNGWMLQGNGGGAVMLPETMPDTNPTYVARWLDNPSKPASPKVTAKTRSTLTVEAVPGQEYALAEGAVTSPGKNPEWVPGPTFTGLTPGAEYSVFTRVAATDSAVASEVSDPTVARLPHAVLVRLDPGAHDLVAKTASVEGVWQNPDPYPDTATPARLAAEQARSFLKDEGAVIEMQHMADITRDGYRLEGWYTQGGVRMESTLGAVSGYFDDAAQKGTEADPFLLTLTARWTPRMADIVYDPNNGGAGWMGEAPAVQTADYGETVEISSLLPKAPEGQRFVCWQNAKTGERYNPGASFAYTDVNAADIRTVSAENNVITLKAVYEDKPAASGMLVFDSREGSAVSSLNVIVPDGKESVTVVVTTEESSTATGSTSTGSAPSGLTFSVRYKDGEVIRGGMAAPLRTGYTFAGWTDDVEGAGAKASFEVNYTRDDRDATPDHTVYAIWKVNTYTLSFDTQGGTEIAPVTQDYGTVVSAPKDPEKKHYDFDGWNPALPAAMPAGDLTILAQWKPVQYTISFDTDGGSAVETITAAFGTRITAPADPVRDGYVFNGWKLKDDDDEAVTLPETMPDTNPTYVARWLENPVKPASPKVIAKTRSTLTVEILDGQEYTLGKDDADSPAENTKWTREPMFEGLTPGRKYSVFTRVAATEGAVASEISDPTATRLPHAVKIRLDLGAYDLVAQTESVEGVWQDPDSYTDQTTPARLTAAQHRSFLKDEGAVIEMQHMADISRDGYSLTGWYTRGNVRLESTLGAVSSYYDDATPAGTEEDPFVITLTAQWIPRTADIVYDTNNDGAGWTGEAPAAQTAAYGETVEVTSVLPKAPEEQRFVCWENPKSGRHYDAGADLEYTDLSTAEFTADSEKNNVITLKAVYENKPAAPGVLVFDSREGSAVSSLNVTIPEGKESVTVIVSMDAPGAASGDPASEGENAGQTFSVRYQDGEEVRSGIAAPARTGHTFLGWTDEAEDAGAKASFEVLFTRDSSDAVADQTVYAVWQVNTYTITFDTLGGTEIAPITQAYGTAVSAPENPTKNHYAFDGWNPALPAAMPAGYLTVLAQWKPVQYTISFDTDGGSAVEPITAVFGARITAPADPVRGGYVFNGWMLKGGEDIAVSLPETMPDTNPTYVARWLVNPGKPASPKVIAKTRSTLTVDAVAGQEYALAEGAVTSLAENVQWVDEPYFTALTPGRVYSVFTRVKATNGAVASEVSDPTVVQLPHAVMIRLDLGAYDLVANTVSVEGGWQDPDPYPDTATPARLTAKQARSFLKDEGAVIEMQHMADITRDGYRLEGWYTQGSVRMESTLGAVSGYYDDADQKGTEEEPYIITLTARWTPRMADIVYDTNNDGAGWMGETPAVQTADYGETVEITSLLPKAPEGQRFVCWQNAKTGERYNPGASFAYTDVNAANIRTVSAENNVITLKAVYEEKSAATGVLRFDSREGSAVSSLTVTIPEGKESVTVVVTTEESGAAAGSTPTDGADSGLIFSVRYKDGEVIRGGMAAPLWTGHTFTGWTDDAEGAAAKASFEVTFARDAQEAVADHTVYAVWNVNTYNISFDTLGGTEIEPITQAYGTAISAPENPVKDHYDFGGWNPALPAVMPASDLTVTAQWKASQYQIFFETNGGSAVEPIVAAFGARITAPADPVRGGYVFNGWMLKGGEDIAVSLPETMPDSKPTYVARWLVNPGKPASPKVIAKTRNTLTVEAVAGQEYAIAEGSVASLGESAAWVPGPTFTGLTPGGVYSVFTRVAATEGAVASEVSDPMVVQLPHAVMIQLDLGAYDLVAGAGLAVGVWQDPDPYTDTLTPARLAAEQYRSFRKDEGATIEMQLMAEITRDGYSLEGWYTQGGVRMESALGAISSYYDDASHAGTEADPFLITLTARWTPRTADLVYDTNNGGAGWTGEAPAARNVAYGETVMVTSVLPKARDGQLFVGWENAKTGERYNAGASFDYMDPRIAEIRANSTENNRITLRAVYEDKSAATGVLRFDSREGSAVASLNVTIPAGKESAAFVLATEENGGASGRTFSLRYRDGEAIRSGLTVPTRTGHTFMGWTDDAAEGAEARASFEIVFTRDERNAVADHTVFAVWQVNSYTLTFDTLGGTAIAPITQACGTAISAPQNPTKNHYEFDGWDPALPETMPAGDLTILAQWKPVQYTVSFDPAGGSEVETITAAFGTRISAPADPVRGGYVFNGWMLKDGDGGAVMLPETMPDTNPTYIARWLENPAQPASPKIIAKTRNTLTVDAVAGQEYAIVEGAVTSLTGNVQWVDGPTFTDLTPGGVYSVFTRVAAREGAEASEVSDPTTTQLPHAVKVRLDLGARDAVAGEGHVDGGWQDTDPYTDTATQAYLSAEQYRSFGKDEGATIEMQLMADITRDGYRLEGWYTQGGVRMESTLGAISSYYDDDTPAGTEQDPFFITLKARWTPRTADVVYDTNNGGAGWEDEAPAAAAVAWGGTVVITSARPETREGWLFAGWKNEKSGEMYSAGASFDYTDLSAAEIIPGGTENNLITLKAVYAEKPAETCVLRFDSREGTEVSPLNVTIPTGEETETVLISTAEDGTFSVWNSAGALLRSGAAVPTRTGYTFAGWTDEADGDEAAAVTQVEFTRKDQGTAAERTVYALWTLNLHTLTFTNLGIAEDIRIEGVPCGAALSAEGLEGWPTEYAAGGRYDTKPHHTFVAWELPSPAVMPDRDLTVQAVWEQTRYTVRFADGETGAAFEDLQVVGVFGTKLDHPADPVREGEIFKGWYTAPAKENSDLLVVTLPDRIQEDVTYYTVWKTENPRRPEAPVIEAAGTEEIRVKDPAFDQEYRVRLAEDEDAEWSPWQKPEKQNDGYTLRFTGLQPATAYEAQARYVENENYKISESSDPSKPATTDKVEGGKAKTPVLAGKTSTSLTVKMNPGEEYSIDGGKTWQKGATFSGLTPAKEYSIIARMVETATANAGEASEPLKATTNKAAGGKAKTPVLASKTSTSLTVKTNPGEEYSIDGGKTWQKGATFSGLTAATEYSIIARMAETATANASPVSDPLKATTSAAAATASTGSASVDSSGSGGYYGGGSSHEEEGEPWIAPLATMTALGQSSLLLSWTEMEDAEGYDIVLKPCTGKCDEQLEDPEDGSLPVRNFLTRQGKRAATVLIRARGPAEDEPGFVMNVAPTARCLLVSGLKKETAYSAYVLAWTLEDGVKTYLGSASPTVHCMTGGGNRNESNPSRLTVEKTEMQFRPGQRKKIRASVKVQLRGRMPLQHGRTLRYISSDTRVAKVNLSGEIKAKSSGSCQIYVLTCNGLWEAVQVDVE